MLSALSSQEIQYRAWSPPQSSIEIEYSDELLREVRLTSLLGDASGILYGIRNGQWIRVVAARRVLSNGGVEADRRLSGLEPVGMFSARARGQVFLTESDLQRLDLSEGAVALVVAGSRAGFFVYEADGSIETIKSQAEFPVPDIAPLVRFVEPPKFVIETARTGAWIWLVPMVILAIAVIFTTQSYWQPRPAIALTAQDQSGQLRIRWNPAAATSVGVTLEISDGDAHISMPLLPEFASTTYVRRSSDVQIHLTAAGHTETVRFFGADIPPSPLGINREQVNQLEAEAETVDAALERGARRIARLEAAISSLLHAP